MCPEGFPAQYRRRQQEASLLLYDPPATAGPGLGLESQARAARNLCCGTLRLRRFDVFWFHTSNIATVSCTPKSKSTQYDINAQAADGERGGVM